MKLSIILFKINLSTSTNRFNCLLVSLHFNKDWLSNSFKILAAKWWNLTGRLSILECLKVSLQLNLAIRNFSVNLKLFLNAKCSLFLWSKWQIGHRKWFLNTYLFLIKQFFITKFDCTNLKNNKNANLKFVVRHTND